MTDSTSYRYLIVQELACRPFRLGQLLAQRVSDWFYAICSSNLVSVQVARYSSP